MKKKKMKRIDFKTGDKVYCLMFGNGIIQKFEHNSIIVSFGDSLNEDEYVYFDNGILNCIEYDEVKGIQRTLYHGHDLEVTIKEKKPERFKWVNLKFNPNTKNGTITSRNYNTKKSALENISNFIKEPWVYIDTIQLIPNHLKEK